MASDQGVGDGDERSGRRLSGVDSFFLGVEAPSMPMHVGLALVLEPGGQSADELAVDIGRRLSTVPDLRATLAGVPLGLRRPRLAPHGGLDVRAHVRTCRLPLPGGIGELEMMVAAEMARPLDRHRPLWEVVVVDGLDGGRVAVVAKVHHALVDGMAGIETMAALFGPTASVAHPEDGVHPGDGPYGEEGAHPDDGVGAADGGEPPDGH
ncbi:MAG: wax ester/triacylglycerol synthase domain-containing protein, partial [Acidimicrobiales bacterium]